VPSARAFSRRVPWTSLLVVLALSSCASQAGTLFEPHRYPNLRVRAAVEAFEVRDARSPEAFGRAPPAVTLPGDNGRMYVPIAPATVLVLERRAHRLIGGGDARLEVVVTLQQACAGFRANFTTEYASATASVLVEVRDEESKRLLLVRQGTVSGEQGSIDTSAGELDGLLQAAIVKAFDRALGTEDALRSLATELSHHDAMARSE
jgi:hypothetical protein